MHTVDEQPETIHLYVVREAAPKPPLLPIFLSFVALSLVIAIGVLSPNQQPVTRAVIRVPAVPLATKTFTAVAPVIPTGVHAYPATTAHGVLTITNGSVIAQTLPAGLTFISNTGISVITDDAVFVPAGSANSYGWAQVRAHAVVSGQRGNLPPYSINSVVGSSIFIRNMSSLYGGQDAYSVKFVTSNDHNVAFSKIRDLLASKLTGLHYPCTEGYTASNQRISSSWRCTFVSYQVPAYMHVSNVQLIGKQVILSVWFVMRPVHIWVK